LPSFQQLTLAKIFSDEPTAYGPINFLVTTWRKSVALSGYQQQDAHEFFISTLNH
jgi:ubiquitin carboxyl-terminal hydrolase 22/27/51